MEYFTLKEGDLEILKITDNDKKEIEDTALTNNLLSKPTLKIKKSFFEGKKKLFFSSAATPFLLKADSKTYMLTDTQVETKITITEFKEKLIE